MMRSKVLFPALVVLLGLLIASPPAFPQEKNEAKISEIFRKYCESVDGLKESHKLGFSVDCEGDPKPVPGRLGEDLRRIFPKFDIRLVTLRVVIDPPASNYDLIVFFDTDKKTVIGIAWTDYWMLPVHKSFRGVLASHRAGSIKGAADEALTLAKLFALGISSSVGEPKTVGRVVLVPLYRGEGVFAHFRIILGKDFSFRELSITDSKGQRLKVFT